MYKTGSSEGAPTAPGTVEDRTHASPECSGSRVGLKKGSERMVVHRLHPEPDTGKKTVRDIASFLKTIGIEP